MCTDLREGLPRAQTLPVTPIRQRHVVYRENQHRVDHDSSGAGVNSHRVSSSSLRACWEEKSAKKSGSAPEPRNPDWVFEIPARNLVSASDTAGTLNYGLLTAGLT